MTNEQRAHVKSVAKKTPPIKKKIKNLSGLIKILQCNVILLPKN